MYHPPKNFTESIRGGDVSSSKVLSRASVRRGTGRGDGQQPLKILRKDFAIPGDPVERNLRGRVLEREGFVENAIEFYQANIRDGFEGSFPYDRLAVIFRQRGDVASEIAVLNRAIEVFTGLQNSPRTDVSPKVAKFTSRLFSAQRLIEAKNKGCLFEEPCGPGWLRDSLAVLVKLCHVNFSSYPESPDKIAIDS